MRARDAAIAAGAVAVLGGVALAVKAAQSKADAQPLASITVAQLREVMPNLAESRAVAFVPLLNAAMREHAINTVGRVASFLAQLAHESMELKHFEEIASGAAYEGRKDLGNTQPGDGVRFKGRGPIQLTGRANYTTAGKALGLDLVGNPAQAAEPGPGFRVAGWFWTSRGLNALADGGDFTGITLRINGGFLGLAQRLKYLARARAVFARVAR